MKTNRMTIMLVALALAGAAAAQDGKPARSQADRPPRNEPPGGPLGFAVQMLDHPRVASALKLTDAQKAQIKEKGFAQQKERIRLRAELETAGLEQAKLLSAESPDLNALLQVVEKTGNLHTEMAKLRIKNLVEIRSILTEEQRTALKGVMAKLQDRRRETVGTGKEQMSGDRRRGAGRAGASEARKHDAEPPPGAPPSGNPPTGEQVPPPPDMPAANE